MQSTQWNEIVSFLKALHYEQYADGFKKNGFDLWEIVLELTIDDFKSIGIKPGHAVRIHRQLVLMKTTTPPPPHPHSHPTSTVTITSASSPQGPPSAPQPPHSHRVHISSHRQLRDQLHSNALIAGEIKKKLFEAMSSVLNGLQQELIEYNGKFAEPINEMNQRIAAHRDMDVQSLQRNGIWETSSSLFEPMMQNVVECITSFSVDPGATVHSPSFSFFFFFLSL